MAEALYDRATELRKRAYRASTPTKNKGLKKEEKAFSSSKEDCGMY